MELSKISRYYNQNLSLLTFIALRCYTSCLQGLQEEVEALRFGSVHERQVWYQSLISRIIFHPKHPAILHKPAARIFRIFVNKNSTQHWELDKTDSRATQTSLRSKNPSLCHLDSVLLLINSSIRCVIYSYKLRAFAKTMMEGQPKKKSQHCRKLHLSPPRLDYTNLKAASPRLQEAYL